MTLQPAASSPALASASTATLHHPSTVSGAPLAAAIRTPSGRRHTCTSARCCALTPYSCTSAQSGWRCVGARCAAPSRCTARSIGSGPVAVLASTAVSISGASAAGTGCVVTGWRAPCVYSATTSIRLAVSVPVLSTHRTEIAPSVSIAGSRRTRTCCRDRRQAPIAGNTVITIASSSGSIDMASAMPARTACSQSPRIRPYASTRTTLNAMPSTANARASAALWRCSGDGAGRSDCRDAAIRPSSLRAPVAVTRAIA